MQIKAVISNLNAWTLLKESKSYLLTEIEDALAEMPELVSGERNLFGSRSRSWTKLLSLGWVAPEWRITSNSSTRTLPLSIDFMKDGVGLEIFVGKRQYLESLIFIQLQALKNANISLIPLIVLPMEAMRLAWRPNATYFEAIKSILVEFNSISIRYPFAVVGVSDELDPENKVAITELNSEFDNFLIQRLGWTFNEMIVMGESDHFEFKVEMPDNEKIAKEACGFANIENGGIVIFGISDNRSIVGVPDDEWDTYQTKLTNILATYCMPCPQFRLLKFDIEYSERKIIVLDILELDSKPCMHKDFRIYVRKAATVRPAASEDIRRMIVR